MLWTSLIISRQCSGLYWSFPSTVCTWFCKCIYTWENSTDSSLGPNWNTLFMQLFPDLYGWKIKYSSMPTQYFLQISPNVLIIFWLIIHIWLISPIYLIATWGKEGASSRANYTTKEKLLGLGSESRALSRGGCPVSPQACYAQFSSSVNQRQWLPLHVIVTWIEINTMTQRCYYSVTCC